MDTTIKDTRPLTDNKSSCCIVSWSAIFAGALIAFSLSALFNLLNAGLGLVLFPETFHALLSLSVAGYIWLIICGIIALFIAGFITGKILRYYSTSPFNGMLHGFLAWSLALLVTVMLASHFATAAASQIPAGVQVAVDGTQSAQNETTSSSSTSDNMADNQHVAQESKAIGGATIGIFFIFLLSAIAAIIGGYLGTKTGRFTRFDQ